MGSFIVRQYTIRSSLRGRLDYASTGTDMLKKLKRWKEAGIKEGEIIYAYDSVNRVFSLYGKVWVKVRPVDQYLDKLTGCMGR